MRYNKQGGVRACVLWCIMCVRAFWQPQLDQDVAAAARYTQGIIQRRQGGREQRIKQQILLVASEHMRRVRHGFQTLPQPQPALWCAKKCVCANTAAQKYSWRHLPLVCVHDGATLAVCIVCVRLACSKVQD